MSKIYRYVKARTCRCWTLSISRSDFQGRGGGLNEFDGKSFVVFPYDDTPATDILFTGGIRNGNGDNIIVAHLVDVPCGDEGPAKAHIAQGRVIRPVFMSEDDLGVVNLPRILAVEIKRVRYHESRTSRLVCFTCAAPTLSPRTLPDLILAKIIRIFIFAN